MLLGLFQLGFVWRAISGLAGLAVWAVAGALSSGTARMPAGEVGVKIVIAFFLTDREAPKPRTLVQR